MGEGAGRTRIHEIPLSSLDCLALLFREEQGIASKIIGSHRESLGMSYFPWFTSRV